MNFIKYNIYLLICILIFSLLVLSCKKGNEENPLNSLQNLIKLKEGYASGASAKVEIWGEKNFFTGFNNLTVVVYDSLKPLEKIIDAHIHLLPNMTMGSGQLAIQHSTPVENPAEESVNNVFPGAIAFVMPTAMGGSWKLNVDVHNHKYDKEGEAEFDITVDNPQASVLAVLTSQSADSSKLVLSLVKPTAPKVGINDIEFTIHRKVTMMDWPADDSYSIEISPEMPSMGHGSPNNVNPLNTGNGHYKGKVNFTMTGEWKINVAVKKGDVVISKNAAFMIAL